MQNTENGRPGAVSVMLVDVVTGAKMVRSQTEEILYTGDDFRTPGVQGPVEVLGEWRWRGSVVKR